MKRKKRTAEERAYSADLMRRLEARIAERKRLAAERQAERRDAS
jgi:hypothetical protein